MKKNSYYLRLVFAGIVLLLSILAFSGIFYPVTFLDIEFAPVLNRSLADISLTALLILTVIVLITFLFGRFYCSTLCPLGILQEFCALIFNRKNTVQKNYPFKYFIMVVVLGFMFGGSAVLLRYIDPYTVFGSFASLSIFGLIFVVLLLVLVFFKNRFFCTNICPVGAILGLISKISVNKIYIDKEKCVSCGLCAKSCPSGCINFKENPLIMRFA